MAEFLLKYFWFEKYHIHMCNDVKKQALTDWSIHQLLQYRESSELWK